MKKLVLSFFIISAVGIQIFAQDVPVTVIVNKCISLLGGTVPEGFNRMDRTVFQNEEGYFLITENGIVIYSGYRKSFSKSNEAFAFNVILYDYLEENKWDFNRTNPNGSDVYQKNDVNAIIFSPQRHDDGYLITGVLFQSTTSP